MSTPRRGAGFAAAQAAGEAARLVATVARETTGWDGAAGAAAQANALAERLDTLARADAQLVGRCLGGDQEAWNELVEEYSRYVYAIVGKGFRLQGPDAEDAFQDVFLRIYDRLGSLRDPDALRPWIAQLTRRVCLDRL